MSAQETRKDSLTANDANRGEYGNGMNSDSLPSIIVHKEVSYQIIGACFAVYNEMGCGFLESVYQECLAIELENRSIPFLAQPPLQLSYRGRRLEQTYKPDFLCQELIVVEIKALDALANEHRAQVHNYLHATGYQLGLLVNFGHYPGLERERIALSTGLLKAPQG